MSDLSLPCSIVWCGRECPEQSRGRLPIDLFGGRILDAFRGVLLHKVVIIAIELGYRSGRQRQNCTIDRMLWRQRSFIAPMVYVRPIANSQDVAFRNSFPKHAFRQPRCDGLSTPSRLNVTCGCVAKLRPAPSHAIQMRRQLTVIRFCCELRHDLQVPVLDKPR
ncbi:hypothetical protein DAEQUDRAFT_304878 [Daedalea quercina L-15889]|uniref:Uncharacterized protein n=1 Tax=Daedalea quercina L-15889 TaxID=1314783 RepID=A0A165Q157_9APHY|nr:hypothetical protein DAEQUDRAFT_304878 [Daedalea quercina L-15889]